MAGTITHAYFALDVYNKFDNKLKERLKNYKENLKTYSQGPDILFFSINYKNFKKVKKIGNYVHKHNTRDFFINMVSYIKENNLEKNNDVLTFLYGYIMHYALDTKVHPYVIHKAGIFNKKKKDTYKYNSKHSDIESYIDAYMINYHENMKPNKFKIHKFCFNNNKISKDLSTVIDYTFDKTYGFKKLSTYYKQGLFFMKHSYHFLRYDPHGIRNKLYRFIDKLHPRSIKDFYPITYSYELDKNDYYLNLCNNKWCHPRYNNEVYTESFIDLYNNAVDNAVYMINKVNEVLFENKDIKILNDVFLNLSLTSGKECNDKGKNRYFEY